MSVRVIGDEDEGGRVSDLTSRRRRRIWVKASLRPLFARSGYDCCDGRFEEGVCVWKGEGGGGLVELVELHMVGGGLSTLLN